MKMLMRQYKKNPRIALWMLGSGMGISLVAGLVIDPFLGALMTVSAIVLTADCIGGQE